MQSTRPVPASTSPGNRDGAGTRPVIPVPETGWLHEEVLPGGAMWSWVLKRGMSLRITALEGGGNVSLLAFNRDDFLDRYNMADTLKAQHTAKLHAGHVLMSDMGRALLSITGDTVGWHDPLGGLSTAATVAARYGEGNFQKLRNRFHRNGRDNFLIELGKWGLGLRDLIPHVNFFSKVVVDESGQMRFCPGHTQAGDAVDLRAELNTLVVLNTCVHALDPEPVYAPKRFRVALWRTEVPGLDDYCRNFRPETGRAIGNSESLFR